PTTASGGERSTRRGKGVGAANARLIYSKCLAACAYRSQTRTGARIGIDRITHRPIAIAAAGSVYPSVARRSAPTATARSTHTKAAAFSPGPMIVAGRTQRIGAANARLIYGQGLAAGRD